MILQLSLLVIANIEHSFIDMNYETNLSLYELAMSSLSSCFLCFRSWGMVSIQYIIHSYPNNFELAFLYNDSLMGSRAASINSYDDAEFIEFQFVNI